MIKSLTLTILTLMMMGCVGTAKLAKDTSSNSSVMNTKPEHITKEQ